MLKTLKSQKHTRYKVTKGLSTMVQLTLFAVPCSILLLASLISFNYWLLLITGSTNALLAIALCIKIYKINNKKTDTTQQIKEYNK